MQVSNSRVARPWKIRTKHFRASFAAGFEADLEGLEPWKLKQNNMTKKGPFFGPQNVRKSRRAKMDLPSSSFDSQLLLVKSASTWNKRFNRFATMKGPKLDPPGGTTFDFKGVHFLTPFYHVSFARGSKTGPSTDWIRCLLGGPVSLALSLCQYVLRPRRGLGQASPSLEAPRLQALENTGPLSSTEQKGKDCHDQDKQVQEASFGFVFGTWNW